MWLWLLKQWYNVKTKFGGLYASWSKIYQESEEKYLNVQPKWENIDPVTAQAIMDKITWKEDGAKELFDAFHHPCVGDYIFNEIIKRNTDSNAATYILYKKTQDDPILARQLIKSYKKGLGQPDISFDCDDFALWGAARLKDEFKAKVLNVMWAENKTAMGHNVCLYTDKNRYYYMGNWGRFGPFNTVAEIVVDIMKKIKKTELVGWHIFNVKDLIK